MQQARNRALSEAQTQSLRLVNGVPDGWMTTGGAAKYLNLEMDDIWTAIKAGKLTGQKFGRLHCFTKEMLDEYDARRRNLSIVSSEPDTPPCEQETVPEPPEEATPEQEPEPTKETPRPWYAEPLPEAPSRLKWSEIQTLATVGKTKKVELSSGLIYLCYDVDLFAASEAERTLLFALIDAIKAYESNQAVPPETVLR